MTDDWDRRTLMNILRDYYNEEVHEENFSFSSDPVYAPPAADNMKAIMRHLKSLPINDDPEIFGLHQNADISSAQQETFDTFDAILLLQPRITSAGSGGSRDLHLLEVRKPRIFSENSDISAVGSRYHEQDPREIRCSNKFVITHWVHGNSRDPGSGSFQQTFGGHFCHHEGAGEGRERSCRDVILFGESGKQPFHESGNFISSFFPRLKSNAFLSHNRFCARGSAAKQSQDKDAS